MNNTNGTNLHFEQRINEIYDHLYANAPVRTPQGIAYEVGKILRTFSYLETNDTGFLKELAALDNKFLKDENNIVVSNIAKKFRKEFDRMNQEKKICPANEQINLEDFDLVYVCYKLEGIVLSDPDRDVYGDAIEVFRSNWVKSHGGQFFTDQRVTRLAMHLLEFNPLKGDDLVDICAGTGGFLLAGLNHLKKILNGNNKESKLQELALKSLKGQEIDNDLVEIANVTFSSRVGKNLDDLIVRGNSIIPDVFSKTKKNRITYDSHLCAATNPPFGTKITIKDNNILREYELSLSYSRSGQNELFPARKISPRSPDTLFIEQNIKLLKPGAGRLAIVVPYQIVSGPQTFFIREWILKNAMVLAVVDLPAETFQPHTGTKASLLVLKRRVKPLSKVDLSNDPQIFMSKPKWIGHDRRGNPVYKRSIDGKITDEILSDFHEVEQAFEAFKNSKNPTEIHSESFAVAPSRLLEDDRMRLDAQFYNPKTNGHHIHILKAKDNEWKIVKIKDVVQRIYYPGRFRRDYIEEENNSVPFLGGTNITQLIVDTDKRLSLDNPHLDQLKVEPGWILITRSGSTGIVSSVPEAWKGYAISEHVIRIIPDEDKLPREYLFAFLKTKQAQEAISRGVYGSVIDEITPEFIGEIDMPIPKSSSVFKTLVNKIKDGEQFRQKAILALSDSVQELDKLILGF